ncbi:hypothetical protein POM88_026664 [Heracleum sosnowskyi]|uniref:Uncharacterized protein n=1 Tax=Heracleum sosnowskyi TaxID=360622 RepID=A0AAD8MKV2_9APIA|nr:hypothetical protein POM88_026664 [Heracleum sosnowskyi]
MRWTFPKKHFVKVNTHVVNYPDRLPNGKSMGLGVVIRDRRGAVVMMVSGTIRGGGGGCCCSTAGGGGRSRRHGGVASARPGIAKYGCPELRIRIRALQGWDIETVSISFTYL